MSYKNLEKTFDFFHQIENLKSTLRYNYTKSGRKESTAEHCWRLSLMVFILSKELRLNLDVEKSIKMALVHDLAESITGDIDAIKIAEKRVSKQTKRGQELVAMEKIKNMLPKDIGKVVYNLWEEYENSLTKEAKFVKAIDKLETLTQLIDVGHRTYDKPEFIANYADKVVKDFPELKSVLKIIKHKLKKEFKKGKIPWEAGYDKID